MADIILIDDYPIVSEALSQLLTYKTEGRFKVIAALNNVSDAIKLTSELKPDLIVVEMFIAGSSCFDLVKELKACFPHIRVLVLSLHDEIYYAEQAVTAGADGYIMKQECSNNIIKAIECILDGQVYLSEKIAMMKLKQSTHGQKIVCSQVHLLAERERQVFELLGRGRTTRKIAQELKLSVKTIETYRTRIKRKLELKTSNELVSQAAQWVSSNNFE